MRLRWVGDARDYVKWDCVFENAKGRFVFYVPMLRRKADATCKNLKVQIHFDQMKDLEQFREIFPGRFEAFGFAGREYSRETASEYFRLVHERLQELQQKHKILVFIDPDTGVEPPSGAKDEHLRATDLVGTWSKLRSGDALIVYQHAPRVNGWEERFAARAADILGMKTAGKLHQDRELAGDVCFLVLEKAD